MEKLELKWKGNDPGFCRVYFKDQNRNLYCIQDEGYSSNTNFVLNICSKDGEPSHPVSLDIVKSIQLLFDDGSSSCELERGINEFIKKYNKVSK